MGDVGMADPVERRAGVTGPKDAPVDQSRAGHGTGSGPRLVFLTHVCQAPSGPRCAAKTGDRDDRTS
jgi:hypothetical protein